MTEWLVTFRSHAGQVNETVRVTARDVMEALHMGSREFAMLVDNPKDWGITDAVEILCEPPPPN